MQATASPPAETGGPTFDYNIAISIKPRRVADLLVSAIEGGSNYWYASVRPVGDFAKTALAVPAPWYDAPGIVGLRYLQLEVVASDDATKHIISRKDLRLAFVRMAEKHPSQFGHFLADNEDASTADIWFQLAVFGEVRYG